MGGILPTKTVRFLGGVVMLAACYVLAGRLGLLLGPVAGFASLVWAPTGIALAALVLWGVRFWPGVAIGALLVNLWAGAALPVAAGIAIGNTVEALAGALALRLIPGFRPSLDRIQDAIGLVVLAAGTATIFSATIGVASLLIGGVITRDMVGVTWGAWWMGDAIGALVIGPLLLTWGAPRHALPRPSTGELIALWAAVFGVSLFIFAGEPRGEAFAFLQPYLLAPLLIWAALRFDTRVASSAVFAIGAMAVWGTANGLGPFHDGALTERLRSLQAFMSLLAPTLLVLAAVAGDRRRAEAALREARDAAEEASLAKSRFLAVMSHELRTPLTGILGYAELMQAGIGGQLSAKHSHYVGRLVWSASYLISLIEGILTFSRADAGRDQPRLEDIDLTELARDAITVVEPLATTRGLRIRLDAPDTPLRIRTDPGKLRQIVLSLLGNAVKFSEQGTIELRLSVESDGIAVRVRDEGFGIPSDDLDRIFEPFTQLENGGRTPVAGTGLGLSVCRTFARLLGGSIDVVSSLGRGSTFTLRLPLPAHHAAGTTPSDASPRATTTSVHS